MTVEESSDSGLRPGETEEDAKARKRKERLEQNRISARESRKRKKSMIEELQRTVITLSKENKELNERNETLRRQLMEIGAKYPNIVPLQAIVGQATATPPTGEAPAAEGVPAAAASSAAGQASSSFLNPLNWIGADQKAADAPAGGSGSASV